uniref:Uncharacterized protein n=1 Tax=Oryza sativa subsp. japonica TaxID=39947 RepID=Q6K2L8_ORYSJ|nr:hypothetical protein [Oryza sativa Japonica Group]BAD22454.1 hypothetical protein [Oryza sativa Japonica Group]
MDPPFIGKEESTVPIHECKNRTYSKEFDMLRLVNVSPSKLTGSFLVTLDKLFEDVVDEQVLNDHLCGKCTKLLAASSTP